MPIFEHGEIKIEVDEDGFIQEPEVWNENVAKAKKYQCKKELERLVKKVIS